MLPVPTKQLSYHLKITQRWLHTHTKKKIYSFFFSGKIKKKERKIGITHANLFFFSGDKIFCGEGLKKNKRHTQKNNSFFFKGRHPTASSLSSPLHDSSPAQGGRGESRQAPGIVGIFSFVYAIFCIYYNSVCVCIGGGLKNLFHFF